MGPLKRLAAVCYEQGLSETSLSCPTMLEAIVRVGVSGPRAKPWMVSPDPADERQNTAGTACSSWPRRLRTSC
jgi:hypothetical protein